METDLDLRQNENHPLIDVLVNARVQDIMLILFCGVIEALGPACACHRL
jgi:hypothetical protein